MLHTKNTKKKIKIKKGGGLFTRSRKIVDISFLYDSYKLQYLTNKLNTILDFEESNIINTELNNLPYNLFRYNSFKNSQIETDVSIIVSKINNEINRLENMNVFIFEQLKAKKDINPYERKTLDYLNSKYDSKHKNQPRIKLLKEVANCMEKLA